MCGIAGELRWDQTKPDQATMERMLNRLARRGPDDQGQWFSGPVALGHRRLSIIDLSDNAHQPMQDASQTLTLVFNGTIYNYRELRKTLQDLGHRFRSESDTEVILHAWRAWGDQCVVHLQGMFAFALWDERQQLLFLARDRLGIKPLYYSRQGDCLRFASTPQALLSAGGVDTSINPVGLHHQLTLHGVIPAPHTSLNGVCKLAPATTLSISPNRHTVTQTYWQLSAVRPSSFRLMSDWVEGLEYHLMAAVKKRVQAADVPVGVLLSGGLDSSLLVGLLAKSGVSDFSTFSIGFEDTAEESGNEFVYSDQVVEKFSTRHRKYLIPNDQVLKRLPEAVSCMSEPMVGQDAVAFYLLAEQVSKEVKVVLSGQGADEVFGGYFWYPQMANAVGDNLTRFAPWYFDRNHQEYLRTVNPDFHGMDHTSATVDDWLSRPNADSFMDQVLRMDVNMLIVDDPVKRVDNMTMSWGLEARVPFLDSQLVEYAAQMPPNLKLHEGGKYPLKLLSRGLLPDAVIDRPKGYFPMPALKYVRGGFFDWMRDILLSPAAQNRGLFQSAYVNTLLAEPDRHFTPLRGSKLWHLALLELWLQKNVDVAP